MVVKILPYDKGAPAGKLADAELQFDDGQLQGLKLVGFAIWERRSENGSRTVSFPARSYVINGARRSYPLLRIHADARAPDQLRDLILQAYDEFTAQAAVAS